MDKDLKNRIESGLDVLIALFILLTGIFVILFGMTWSNYIETITSGTLKDWFATTPWILNFIGIATILYGLKRLIHNLAVLKE